MNCISVVATVAALVLDSTTGYTFALTCIGYSFVSAYVVSKFTEKVT
jgi:hypothetical protein